MDKHPTLIVREYLSRRGGVEKILITYDDRVQVYRRLTPTSLPQWQFVGYVNDIAETARLS